MWKGCCTVNTEELRLRHGLSGLSANGHLAQTTAYPCTPSLPALKPIRHIALAGEEGEYWRTGDGAVRGAGRRGEDEGKGWWRCVWVVARLLHQQTRELGYVWQTSGDQCAEDTLTRNGTSYKEHRRAVMVRC